MAWYRRKHYHRHLKITSQMWAKSININVDWPEFLRIVKRKMFNGR